MRYMTNMERFGREEGMQLGMQQGFLLDKQKVLQRLLDKKFGLTDQEKNFISRQFDPDLLDKALDEILFANSKEEVLNHLQ